MIFVAAILLLIGTVLFSIWIALMVVRVLLVIWIGFLKVLIYFFDKPPAPLAEPEQDGRIIDLKRHEWKVVQ